VRFPKFNKTSLLTFTKGLQPKLMATSHICATIYRITLPFERAYLAYFALLTTVKNALFSWVSQEALSYEINQKQI